MTDHKICTVIVTYNRLGLLQNAIGALKYQTLGSTLLIVDNGSTDGTHEYLDSLKDVVVIHQENLGGAGGFFTGLKFAAENGFEFAWIMDDDVLPDKDALRFLIEAFIFCNTLNNNHNTVDASPQYISPVCPMPYTCQSKDYSQVQQSSALAHAAAAKRDIDIFLEPRSERNVPPAPKLAY